MYTTPSRQHLAYKILKGVEDAIRASMFVTIPRNATGIKFGLSNDGWSSITKSGITTVCLSWIEQNDDGLRFSVMNVGSDQLHPSHTGKNIAAAVELIMDKYLPDWLKPFWKERSRGCVQDNATTQKKAARLLGIDFVNCTPHTLELGIREMLKHAPIKTIRPMFKALHSLFSASVKASGVLEEVRT
jgi:hypothetical protein